MFELYKKYVKTCVKIDVFTEKLEIFNFPCTGRKNCDIILHNRKNSRHHRKDHDNGQS